MPSSTLTRSRTSHRDSTDPQIQSAPGAQTISARTPDQPKTSAQGIIPTDPEELCDDFGSYIALDKVREYLQDIRRISTNTAYRWANQGLYGVRLRADMLGSKKFTTPKWLAEFFRDTARAEQQTKEPAVVLTRPGPSRSPENRHGI